MCSNVIHLSSGLSLGGQKCSILWATFFFFSNCCFLCKVPDNYKQILWLLCQQCLLMHVLVFPSWMQHPLVTQLISSNNSAEHINLLLHVNILPWVLSQNQHCHKRLSELLFYKAKQNRKVGTYIIKNSRTQAESKYFTLFISCKWNAWRRLEEKGEDENRRTCQRGQWCWELSESPGDVLKALLR